MSQFKPNSNQDSWEEPGTNSNQETMAMSSSGSGPGSPPEKGEAPADFANLPITFGRYEVEKKLGEGGMGAVYLAQDTQLNRKVALKIPKFAQSNVSKLRERFHREARAAATLSHPNICPVFDAGEINGIHYMAMGFVQGRSLSIFTRTEKRQTVRSAVLTVRKVALALQEAHVHGVIHRDLKPANIMIDHRNEPIVMDFGLACQPDQNNDSRLTQDGAILGSPAYMSPEQLEGKTSKLGPACDVYSLGVVLFELLTGELPYKGTGSIMSIIGEVFSKDTPDPAERREDLDPRLSFICRKAMAKEAENRYSTMQEFADELTLFLKTAPEDANSAANKSDSKVASGTAELIRAKEQYELAQSLCKSGQIAAAVAILEKMAQITNPNAKQYVDWAKSELGQLGVQSARDTIVESSLPGLADDDIWREEFEAPAATNAPLGKKSAFLSANGQTNWLPYLIAVSIGALIFMLGLIVVGAFSRAFDNDPPPAPPNPNAASSNAVGPGASGNNVENPPPSDPRSGRPGDGRFGERRPGFGGPRGEGPRDGSPRRPFNPFARLAEADKNGDGKISKTEVPPQMQESFRKADTNQNGFIEPEELRAAAKRAAQRIPRPRPPFPN